MKYYIALLIIFFSQVCSTQSNAILEIESNNQAFELPILSESERLAMDISAFTDQEGLLVFDKTNNYIYYYNSFIQDWAAMGDANADSPIGPPGPIGMAGMGQQGPVGTPGIHCWDVNGNGISEDIENVTGGLFDGRDCQNPNGAPVGLQGDKGPLGPPGPSGPKGNAGGAGVVYELLSHTVNSDISSSFLFSANDPNERIFVQGLGNALPANIYLTNDNRWFLTAKKPGVENLTAGSIYQIIRVPAP